MSEPLIRVLLADDHAIVMEGLQSLITNTTNIRTIATASDGERLVDAVERFKPDVVVMDVHMPHLNGLEAVPKIRQINPKIYIIFLTAYTDVQTLQEIIESGVEGVLYKTDPPQQIIHAIRQVMLGQLVFPASARKLLYQPRREQNVHQLSEREMNVLALVAQGMSNAQIAHQLQITISTVKFHLQNIYQTLNVANRTEAGYWYLNQRS